MAYNSKNTKVLATHDQDGNVRMLLLHEMKGGRIEYIVGSYFTESHEYMPPDSTFPEGVTVDRSGDCWDEKTGRCVGQANNWLSYQDPAYYDALIENDYRRGNTVHYSWDWGHYFNGDDALLRAVEFWKREVIWREAELFAVHDSAEKYSLEGFTLQVMRTNDGWSAAMYDPKGMPTTYSVSAIESKEEVIRRFKNRHRPTCTLESLGAVEK